MTLGGTTVGGAAVGSTDSGILEVALPSRDLTLTRPGEDRTGETGTVGGVGIGGAAVGGTATEPLTAALPATGFGTVNAPIPGRILTLSRTPATATGTGTATVTIPTRALTLARAVPGVSLRVAIPSRDLNLTRPGEDVTGETGTIGGVGLGGAAIGGAATEPLTNALPTDYFGFADVSIPSRSLTLSRGEVSPLYLASVPARTLTLSRDPPPATGVGTVDTAIPSRTLTLTRESPAFGYLDWVLDGTPIELITDESATHSTLSLVIRSERQQLIDTLRPLKSDEGKVSVRGTNAGGYRAIERADGANTFEINAPVERTPLRPGIETYHVDRYEESLVDPNLSEWDVELDLIPERNRTDTPSLSQTPAADEWGIETRYGEIATGRVDAEFAGTGADGVDRFDLTVRLTFEQAHVFEAALSRLEGVRVRNIPDATNEPIDDTDDDANTVTIDAPDGQSVVDDGEYVVMEWSDSKITDAYQELSVVISPKL